MIIAATATISAPAGLFSDTPTGAALDFTGAVIREVKPVFDATVQQIKDATPNKNIAAQWQETQVSGDSNTVEFSSQNTHRAAAPYYFGAQAHTIPQPAHTVPLGKLTAFYQGTRGLPYGQARQAAGGFQAWGSRNPWTIRHPGSRAHDVITPVWEAAQSAFAEAAAQAFAQAVSARFA